MIFRGWVILKLSGVGTDYDYPLLTVDGKTTVGAL